MRFARCMTIGVVSLAILGIVTWRLVVLQHSMMATSMVGDSIQKAFMVTAFTMLFMVDAATNFVEAVDFVEDNFTGTTGKQAGPGCKELQQGRCPGAATSRGPGSDF